MTTEEITLSGLPRPGQVLIADFAVSPGDVEQNSSIFAKLARDVQHQDQTAEEIQLGHEVADALTDELVTKIAAMGMSPQRADNRTPLPAGTIMITGRFVKIDEGNRLRRNMIGFGLGQSSLDSDVLVLASSSSGMRELLSFTAHADSGEMPGAAVMGPAGAAAGAGAAAVVATNVVAGGVKSYRSSAAQQAKQLADKISDRLSDYFARQGWLYQGQP
ncbi:MAG: DUF4410 domain-containing protein [Gammaproteobacteria bacterium]